MKYILNFVLFQAGWFACVLGGAQDLPVVAIAAASLVIGVSLYGFSADRLSDLRLLWMVALIGFCVDSINLWLGVFALIGTPRFPHLCPVWLVALWAVFGTTLRGSLHWLRGRYGLSALLGAVGGSLSYVGGAKLGAVTMPSDHMFSVVVLALVWAVVVPLLIWLAHGRSRPPQQGKELQ